MQIPFYEFGKRNLLLTKSFFYASYINTNKECICYNIYIHILHIIKQVYHRYILQEMVFFIVQGIKPFFKLDDVITSSLIFHE